ncbi:MAG TPA: MFS transporter [Chloroflexia bacterium]|nr:MFS transporter [Chloroflexia bacterium]
MERQVAQEPAQLETEQVKISQWPRNLWRNRNFNIFWAGQTLSALGDAFAIIALPLLVLQITGSVAQMGLVTGLGGICRLLSGLVSGVIVDRLNLRRLMIVCDAAMALTYSLIPLGTWLMGQSQMWLVYSVTAVGALFGNCFQVAYISAVPGLVRREQLTGANSRLQTTFGIAFVTGPALAGFISAQFGPVISIGIDALSFGISCLCLILIKFDRATSSHDEEDIITESKSFIKEWLAGLQFLLRQPTLRAITLLLGGYGLLTTGGLDLFIYHLKHDLGQDDNAVGLVFGLSSIGAILSGLAVGFIRSRLGFGFCFLGGMFVASFTIGAIGQSGSVLLVALLATFFTFFDSIKGISSMSLRQEITPPRLLGRVTAVFWTLISVTGPLGAAILTWLAEHYGAPLVLVLMGVLGIALAFIGLFTPASSRYPEKQSQ